MQKNIEDVGATAFDYPNNVAPKNYNDINRKHLDVPKPNNARAMHADHAKVMRAVNEGK